MAKCISTCLLILCVGGTTLHSVFVFWSVSDFILNPYSRYFSLCVSVGWGGVGYLYVGVVGG